MKITQTPSVKRSTAPVVLCQGESLYFETQGHKQEEDARVAGNRVCSVYESSVCRDNYLVPAHTKILVLWGLCVLVL